MSVPRFFMPTNKVQTKLLLLGYKFDLVL